MAQKFMILSMPQNATEIYDIYTEMLISPHTYQKVLLYIKLLKLILGSTKIFEKHPENENIQMECPKD